MKSSKKKKRSRRPEPVVVRLKDKDRSDLRRLTSRGGCSARVFNRARALLLMDEGLSAPLAAKAPASTKVPLGASASATTRAEFEHAIYDAPRPGPEFALDERQEAAEREEIKIGWQLGRIGRKGIFATPFEWATIYGCCLRS